MAPRPSLVFPIRRLACCAEAEARAVFGRVRAAIAAVKEMAQRLLIREDRAWLALVLNDDAQLALTTFGRCRS